MTNTEIFIVGGGSVGRTLLHKLAPHYKCTLITRSKRPNLQFKLTESYLNPPQSNPVGNYKSLIWEELTGFPEKAIIFIAVKAFDLPAVSELIRRRIPTTQILVFMQNGLNIFEIAKGTSTYPKKVRASVVIPVVTENENDLLLRGAPTFTLASESHNDKEGVISVLRSGGINIIDANNHVAKIEWEKALFNLYVNGPSALFDYSIGEIFEHEESRNLAEAALSEAIEVAKHENVEISEEIIDYTRNRPTSVAKHIPSMLQDLRAGKRTEKGALYQTVFDLGARYGLKMEATSLMCESLNHLEHHSRDNKFLINLKKQITLKLGKEK